MLAHQKDLMPLDILLQYSRQFKLNPIFLLVVSWGLTILTFWTHLVRSLIFRWNSTFWYSYCSICWLRDMDGELSKDFMEIFQPNQFHRIRSAKMLWVLQVSSPISHCFISCDIVHFQLFKILIWCLWKQCSKILEWQTIEWP